jgi:hypothetical protein
MLVRTDQLSRVQDLAHSAKWGLTLFSPATYEPGIAPKYQTLTSAPASYSWVLKGETIMARSSAQTRVLTDPEEIRMWAEERSAKPTCVKRTGGSDDVGIIRLDFPGYRGENSLQEIDWDDWFEKFADSNLALLVQDTTAGGQQSNFNKLVSREMDQRDEGSRSSRSEGRSSSSRRSNRSSSRSSASRSGSRTGRKQRTSARQASSRNRATSGSTGSSRRSTRSQSSGSAKRRAGSGKTRVIGRASSTGKKSSGRSSSRTTRRAA